LFTLEPWRLFLEPWQLILEQRRLNVESGSSKAMALEVLHEARKLILAQKRLNMEPGSSKETWRFTLEQWRLSWSLTMAAHLGAEQAQHGG
jgi:hypothetical protein